MQLSTIWALIGSDPCRPFSQSEGSIHVPVCSITSAEMADYADADVFSNLNCLYGVICLFVCVYIHVMPIPAGSQQMNLILR